MVTDRKNPIWIVWEGAFEGHQAHWADVHFSNATEAAIREFVADGALIIREMTDDEVIRYPEAVIFRESLIKEYGTA